MELELSASRDLHNQKSNSSSATFSTSPVSFSALFGDCLKIDLPVERSEQSCSTRVFPDVGSLASVIGTTRGDLICVPANSTRNLDCACFEVEDSSRSEYQIDTSLSLDKTFSGTLTVDAGELVVGASPAGSDSGCQSEEQSSINDEVPLAEAIPKKRRGGWPKGKKRKEALTETEVPKAPSTGYVIYLNERGREMRESHPHLPFPEVTRILGREWTKMTTEEKQKYLSRAEEDKRRYREELKAYQHSEAYQVFLKTKRLKSLDHQSTENEQPPTFTLHDIEEEDGSDLYCKICNQLFVSLHNKKEHLYGRQHLQAITGKIHQETGETRTQNLNTSEEECDGVRTSILRRDHISHNKTQGPANVSQAIQDLISLTAEREEELKHLWQSLAPTKEKISSKQKEMVLYQEKQKVLQLELENLKSEGAALSSQLVSLRMVPQLFGLINF